MIDKLEVGELSEPVLFENEEGKQGYRILYLKNRTEPHIANLKDDYNVIQEWALSKKKSEVVDKWVKEKIDDAYIKIIDEFQSCNYYYKWANEEL